MCELCRIAAASTHIDVMDLGNRKKLAVCDVHRIRLSALSTAESIAAAANRRLDAELADSFPASDPPSILRGGV
jgi:hypothetical protein